MGLANPNPNPNQVASVDVQRKTSTTTCAVSPGTYVTVSSATQSESSRYEPTKQMPKLATVW